MILLNILLIGIDDFLLYHFKSAFTQHKFYNLNYRTLISMDFFYEIKKYKEIDIVMIGINEEEFSVNTDFAIYCNILNKITYLISEIDCLKKVIFLSSYCVYKPKKDGVYNENDILMPSTYISEIYNTYENMIRICCNTKNLEFTILRLFNLYSPLQHKGYVIMSIIHQLFNHEYISIGDTRKKRDYIYIKDFLNILGIIFEKELKEKLNIYNMGTGTCSSIKDIIEMLKNITHIEKEIIFNSDKIRLNYDYESVQADAQKLVTDLKYEFKYDIEKGLKESIEIYRMKEVMK